MPEIWRSGKGTQQSTTQQGIKQNKNCAKKCKIILMHSLCHGGQTIGTNIGTFEFLELSTEAAIHNMYDCMSYL